MRMLSIVIMSTLGVAMPLSGALAGPPADALFIPSDRCIACHNGLMTADGRDVSIGAHWRGSMMAHAARDPYWQAGVRREIMEHPGHRAAIEDKCATCHMPMAHFTARVHGGEGAVFAHLPIAPGFTDEDAMAADGVSCSLCHQITPDKLGTADSFTGGFMIETQKALGERNVYGPYLVDEGRSRVMGSSSHVLPTQAAHLQDAAFCASCHTLYTHALGPDGQVVGELPEQVPYLEWRHSDYEGNRNCQSCHMPELQEDTAVTSVLGKPRPNFSRHVFRGGNFFMPKIFNQHRIELGVEALPQDLAQAAEETEAHLGAQTARVDIQGAQVAEGALQFDVAVRNKAGHKLPTAYPSRRVWLEVVVRDGSGKVVFSSGNLESDGAIAGNDNDADAAVFEPHYRIIKDPDQVQIYEAIMGDHKGRVTTGLLSAVRYLKDNRILPKGFDKATADKDIAVQGGASGDPDFKDSGDTVRYVVLLDQAKAPYRISATLWYQPIAFRWAKNLAAYKAMETERFVRYYNGLARESGAKLASAEKRVE